MTTFPDTTRADAVAPQLLASAMPIDLGAPSGQREKLAVGGHDPVSVRRLVLRFALAGIPVLAAAIVITAIASVRIGTKLGIEDAKRVNYVSLIAVERQGVTPELVAGDPAAITEMDDFVNQYIISGSLVLVKIHTADGTIVYSNEAALIGQRFPLGDDELAVLDGENKVEAEVSDLSKEENALETEDRLLEVYRKIMTTDGTPLLFETYFLYNDVRDVGRSLWSQFAPIAIGALLVLELVQIPFAISLARRLRAGQRQRERLLQHAIESSDAERRRIASDLHDGAVQDLTGVSMSLTASSRVTDDDAARATMADSGGKIRETVKSLRSMLVDIYPPNLHQEGLESALADLLGAVHNRGLATRLEVSPVAASLSPEAVALLYRAAQEALRNVANHSHATTVTVRVTVDHHGGVLTVEDDGVGFDPETLSNRMRRGHVGLRSLAGLVHDAGGAIEIRSVPGVGTRVDVRVAS
ncbi:MAG: sensor histidine kinase [Ilumatobacteraceae bacterium]